MKKITLTTSEAFRLMTKKLSEFIDVSNYNTKLQKERMNFILLGMCFLLGMQFAILVILVLKK